MRANAEMLRRINDRAQAEDDSSMRFEEPS